MRLALDDRGALLEVAGGVDIGHFEFHQVTATQFAVDGEVEQREVSVVLGDLKANADGPDMLGHQGALLVDDTAFVLGGSGRSTGKYVRKCHGGYGCSPPIASSAALSPKVIFGLKADRLRYSLAIK